MGLSLGLFGSGGSILMVPILRYLLKHDGKVAIAESLGIVGVIALISAIPYAKARLLDWRTALLFGPPGMAGAYGGAWIASFVNAAIQLLVFSTVMLAAAFFIWRQQGQPEETGSRRNANVLAALEGLAVGVLTGFVGVGGGFLIVPALVLLRGLNMRIAVATSLVIIALNSSTGFVKYLDVLRDQDLSLHWQTMGVFIVIGVIGAQGGRWLNTRLEQRRLKRGFALFLILMAVFILARESVALVG